MTLSVDNITSSIKTVGWPICSRPPPEPALEPRQKTGRGIYHEATAQLIHPVDYEWSNPQHVYLLFHLEYHAHSLVL